MEGGGTVHLHNRTPLAGGLIPHELVYGQYDGDPDNASDAALPGSVSTADIKIFHATTSTVTPPSFDVSTAYEDLHPAGRFPRETSHLKSKVLRRIIGRQGNYIQVWHLFATE